MNMRFVKHFPVRNLKFFKKKSSKTHYWMGNSAGLTYAMLALSVMFPAGERFFIQSVKKSRFKPEAKLDIFIGLTHLSDKEFAKHHIFQQ